MNFHYLHVTMSGRKWVGVNCLRLSMFSQPEDVASCFIIFQGAYGAFCLFFLLLPDAFISPWLGQKPFSNIFLICTQHRTSSSAKFINRYFQGFYDSSMWWHVRKLRNDVISVKIRERSTSGDVPSANKKKLLRLSDIQPLFLSNFITHNFSQWWAGAHWCVKHHLKHKKWIHSSSPPPRPSPHVNRCIPIRRTEHNRKLVIIMGIALYAAPTSYESITVEERKIESGNKRTFLWRVWMPFMSGLGARA